MAPLNWATYLERAVGKGHPTLSDTVNRALRQLVTASGYAPDTDFTGMLGPVFNVRAFGDNTLSYANLLLAITAAQTAGGGLVWTGPGLLALTGEALVSVSGVRIAGLPGATEFRFNPVANGPCVRFDGGSPGLWDCGITGIEFTATDTTFTKEMMKLVNVRRFTMEDVTSQDGLWNGAGSIGLHVLGRDMIHASRCWFAAEQPLKIDVNPYLSANALDFAFFEQTQFAVQSGVSAYNVEIADGVTWTNVTFRDCDGARGLGFARWLDTTSPNASFGNLFDGCRQEQSIAGATYSWDLESTAQQLQATVFNRCIPGNNINGIKLRKAFYTKIDTYLPSGAGDALNMDSTCRGLTAKSFYLPAAMTTTGLSGVVGDVEIANPDVAPIGNQGDNDATLTTLLSARTQRFTTTLTANRTVTLAATNAHRGAKFRVTRSGLGAFTLDVGGLKTIPSATAAFVDVEHDGSGWRLTGYGTL